MWSIEIKNLHKSFDDKKVIKDLSIKINKGELVSLLGPSGCGKSTTLKIIAGLIKPEVGEVYIDEECVMDVPVEKRGAVIVFQDSLLFPHMTVYENISFGLRMARTKKDIIKKKVDEIIELVQLSGLEDKYPSELSGGEKQRTALARALAVDPKVLLLDEPFSSLDIRLRDSMREFVYELQRRLKITTILVTHDKEEALMLSDRIALILNGELVQYGTPDEIYNFPISKKAADFFSENNYLTGEMEGNIFKCLFGGFKVEVYKSGNVEAMIRPESISLHKKKVESKISGIITKKRYAGDRVYYNISIQNNEFKCIDTSKDSYQVGEEVEIKIDFNKVVFYQ